MSHRPVVLSLLCASGVALALTLTATRCPAQNLFKGGELPRDGTAKLDNDFNKEQRALIRELEEGKVEAGKDQEATIDLLAKWFTYRLTWSDVQNKPGAINQLFFDLEADFGKAAKNENTLTFRQMLARDLARNAREVLQNRLPLVRVNAARVLWEAAPTREPEVANVLVEVVDNPAHNLGTKYWAFKGLQEFLAPGRQMPPPPFKDQKLPNRIALALLGFLGQKYPATDATPIDQVDGLRAVRREAIRALGLTQSPAVLADAGKDKGKLVGRTAQVLLRVVRKEGFVPEPRWDEQVEAAIGVGWLQCKLDPAYQPDYAIYNAAYAVLQFATKYADEKDKPGDRGWRYYSSRLGEAFENLQRDVAKAYPRDKELVGYVTDVAKQTTAVLRLIETRGEARAADFEQWLQGHPPKSETVYKGVADSKVTPGGEPAEK